MTVSANRVNLNRAVGVSPGLGSQPWFASKCKWKSLFILKHPEPYSSLCPWLIFMNALVGFKDPRVIAMSDFNRMDWYTSKHERRK